MEKEYVTYDYRACKYQKGHPYFRIQINVIQKQYAIFCNGAKDDDDEGELLGYYKRVLPLETMGALTKAGKFLKVRQKFAEILGAFQHS